MRLKRILLSANLLLLCTITVSLQAQTLNEIESRRILLPNGWQLTPVGKTVPLGDLPLNIEVSPSRKLAAITNNGQSTQTIQLVNVRRGRVTDSIEIGKSWLGLTFSDNGKYLYASGGNDNIIIKYAVKNKHLSIVDTIIIGKPWPNRISVAGIALDEPGNRLYAVTKENNALYVIDIHSKKAISRYDIGGEGYTCILSPDHKTLYASCWGCDKIVIFDTGQQKITGKIPVGDNPNDLCVTRDGRFLFAANANDNNVSVIDTRQMQVIETLNSALYPDAPSGSTTNSVALSSDEKMLFIANADNNCLAVFDVSAPGS
ncbi:MAG: YncE family protein, partial [Bacteroidales bacterium]|nr:YncE family protein [Bacteroidales bacterium]